MGSVQAAVPSVRRALPALAWFDWLVLAVCSWLVAGAYLDAWAHAHVPRLVTVDCAAFCRLADPVQNQIEGWASGSPLIRWSGKILIAGVSP